MYFLSSEHNPPHIHAIYNDHKSTYSLIDMTKINGDLPIKAEKLVLEWMKLHIDELREIRVSQSFKRIEPLE
jgi:hypothetical protein